MGTNIFINLPVKDIARSVTFFSRLGYKFNPKFSDNNAKCLILDDNICVMLLQESFFKSFTKKEIADTSRTTEAIFTITAESREKVDEFMNNTIEAGGTEVMTPVDQGGMYGRSFQDPDGHLWEIFHMEEQQVPAFAESEQTTSPDVE
jgi:predicted lactoylglutathione lyase